MTAVDREEIPSHYDILHKHFFYRFKMRVKYVKKSEVRKENDKNDLITFNHKQFFIFSHHHQF
jgi:hypothetical protein